MPRPIRLRKPPSAPSATIATATTTTAKKVPTNTTKSRTTRSGTKDIADHEPSGGLPTPSSEDVPVGRSSPTKKPLTKATVVKRSTRSKVSNEPAAPSPSPRKQPTTRTRKVTKAAPEPNPTPPLPTLSLSPVPPSSPEIQVPASSDAENHSPRHFASSPPPLLSTPPKNKRRCVLEFSSDAGYTPPPATKPTSAERPRLRELQPVSLEPLDSLLPENAGEGDETDDTIDPRASPTPKRGRKTGFTPAADYDEEPPTSAQPPRRVLPPPTGGVGFFIDGEENEFIIYSDPGSPTPSLPPAATMDDNMRPPESSPAPTPVKQRKRRSSGAVVDSDSDNGADSQDEAELAAGRGGKKRKGKAAKAKGKVRLMPTSALMDLLPRRKKNTRVGLVDEFDILFTSEESREEEEEDTGNNGSEDELAKPLGRTTRSGRGTKKPVAKTAKGKGKTSVATSGKGIVVKEKGKSKSVAPAAVTKNAWNKTLSGRTGKTYARRSIGSEKENDSPNKVRRSRGGKDQEDDGNSSDTVVNADGILGKAGRGKLKEVVEKFKEVDKWQMEFEDLSPRSLEAGSEQSGR